MQPSLCKSVTNHGAFHVMADEDSVGPSICSVPGGCRISEVTTLVSENVTQNVRTTDIEPREQLTLASCHPYDRRAE